MTCPRIILRSFSFISKEQFEAVSRLMEESAKKHQKKNNCSTTENRYAGKVVCSRCGKAAVRSDNRMKEPVLFYYSCRHCIDELKHENGLTKVPKLPLIKLDALVMATLRKHMDALIQFDDMSELLSTSDAFREKKAQIARDKAKCEKTVSETEKTLSTAYTHHLSGLLDLREYELVRAKVEKDKHEAEARLSQVSAQQRKYDLQNALENKWLVKYRAFRDCETPTKELIQTLIGRIFLTPLSNEVYIELNFEDCFEELQLLMEESGVTVNV